MIKASKRLRPERRPRPKALKQGDLDGLRGVYSAVNAIRLLCPELDGAAAYWLFGCLMEEMPNFGARPEAIVTEGLRLGQQHRLILCAIRKMADEFDVALRVTRLPKPLWRTTRLTVIWSWLAANISSTSVAILVLSGRHSHWTVAFEISGQQIHLFDSGELKVLRRLNCSVGAARDGHVILPAWAFVLRRH